MEIEIATKGLKRLRKGTKGDSSSVAKASPSKRFGAQTLEPHGFTWFNTQKEAKYAPKNWIDEGRIVLEFPTIRDKLYELGVGYIFAELDECNLTLVREFYSNWDTSFGESTEVKITAKSVTLYVVSTHPRWARDHKDTQSTLVFSY
ncbi:hypothetical protein HAX54_012838 [Datura stramonium]|uniref:Uncharacterized protein n=1 Tax=Datura stramonium TaxID=4076 RepID=A0ABS8Y465_DATST|nr:hypothetical protein [Datura stramonium]